VLTFQTCSSLLATKIARCDKFFPRLPGSLLCPAPVFFVKPSGDHNTLREGLFWIASYSPFAPGVQFFNRTCLFYTPTLWQVYSPGPINPLYLVDNIGSFCLPSHLFDMSPITFFLEGRGLPPGIYRCPVVFAVSRKRLYPSSSVRKLSVFLTAPLCSPSLFVFFTLSGIL